MTALIEWTTTAFATEAQHPLVVIAVFIVTFLAIHPFQDGNGRLSRVLTTLLLLKTGYAYVPYASLESVIESTKERYYMALRQTQGTIRKDAPDWAPWLEYFLGALAEQKPGLEKKIEREQLLLGDLPELSVRILELCKERGRVTVSDIERVTGANRNTVKDHLAALTKTNISNATARGAECGTRWPKALAAICLPDRSRRPIGDRPRRPPQPPRGHPGMPSRAAGEKQLRRASRSAR